MFTNHYILYRKVLFCGGATATVTTTYGETGTWTLFPEYSASTRSIASLDLGVLMRYGRCQAFPVSKGSNQVPKESDYGVYFGSGATPPTREDFKLENPITSGLTITNPSSLVWGGDGNGNYSIAADFVLRNTTDAEIVVREVGFVSAIVKSHDADFYPFLMERTVLETPVTIPAGEARLIEYKFTFNQS